MEAAVTVRGTCLSGPFVWQDASVSTDAFEAYVRTTIYRTFVSWWRRRSWRNERPDECVGESAQMELPGGFCDGSHRVEVRDALATQIGDAALLQVDRGSEQAVGPEWIVLETSPRSLVLGSVEDGYAFRQGDSLLSGSRRPTSRQHGEPGRIGERAAGRLRAELDALPR